MSKSTLGFVLEDLLPTQTAYCLTYNINRYLKSHPETDICMFLIDNVPPCIQPRFARYHLKDAFGFDGSLVATSLKTAESIKDFTRASRYYYITDLKDVFQQGLENTQYIFRSKDYPVNTGRDFPVVEDYNIEKILELTNGRNSK